MEYLKNIDAKNVEGDIAIMEEPRKVAESVKVQFFVSTMFVNIHVENVEINYVHMVTEKMGVENAKADIFVIMEDTKMLAESVVPVCVSIKIL
jgi:hypothetical protein